MNKKNRNYARTKTAFIALAVLFVLLDFLTSCTSKSASSTTETGKEVVLILLNADGNAANMFFYLKIASPIRQQYLSLWKPIN